jgi:hypothetical protein
MQSYFKHGMGDALTLYFEIFRNNVGQTGETPTVAIQKKSNDEWLNDTLDGWQAEYNDIALSEASSADLPGIYNINISHIDATAETYNCYFKNTGDNAGSDFEAHVFTGAVYVPSSSAYASETVLGHLDDIKHKDGNKTFDNTTDSLEAIVDNGVSSADLDLIAKEATLLGVSGDIEDINSGLFDVGGDIAKVIVQPVQGNFDYTSIKNQRVEIKRGSSADIPYSLSQNISGYDVYFGVKKDFRSDTFDILEKDITAYVSDFETGTGTINLTVAETDLEDGDYIGEMRLEQGDEVVKPVEFRLRILPTIFT